jgi:hypothetical protein
MLDGIDNSGVSTAGDDDKPFARQVDRHGLVVRDAVLAVLAILDRPEAVVMTPGATTAGPRASSMIAPAVSNSVRLNGRPMNLRAGRAFSLGVKIPGWARMQTLPFTRCSMPIRPPV